LESDSGDGNSSANVGSSDSAALSSAWRRMWLVTGTRSHDLQRLLDPQAASLRI
jgi:hypothetical protein